MPVITRIKADVYSTSPTDEILIPAMRPVVEISSNCKLKRKLAIYVDYKYGYKKGQSTYNCMRSSKCIIIDSIESKERIKFIASSNFKCLASIITPQHSNITNRCKRIACIIRIELQPTYTGHFDSSTSPSSSLYSLVISITTICVFSEWTFPVLSTISSLCVDKIELVNVHFSYKYSRCCFIKITYQVEKEITTPTTNI